MNISIEALHQRISTQADSIGSKVHKADDGTFSWPMNEWNVVLVPLGHFEDYPNLGVMHRISQDDELTTGSTYVFTAEGLYRCVSLAVFNSDQFRGDQNWLSLLGNSVQLDPTDGVPNAQDALDFERTLLFP